MGLENNDLKKFVQKSKHSGDHIFITIFARIVGNFFALSCNNRLQNFRINPRSENDEVMHQKENTKCFYVLIKFTSCT